MCNPRCRVTVLHNGGWSVALENLPQHREGQDCSYAHNNDKFGRDFR